MGAGSAELAIAAGFTDVRFQEIPPIPIQNGRDYDDVIA
jgi:hypothetical protein